MQWMINIMQIGRDNSSMFSIIFQKEEMEVEH